MTCWLAEHGWMEHGDPMSPCKGRLDRAHLIPRQLLKRVGLAHLIPDPRTWVAGCRWHHGQLDFARKLRVPFDALPAETIEFAEEHGLMPYLERTYR